MKFVGIEKKEQGKFITRYDVQYETVDGIVKNYEMISRNGFRTEVFRRLGLIGSSEDWERLVRGVIQEFEENNSGVDLFHFDSDEDVFCVYSQYIDDLMLLSKMIRAACDNEKTMGTYLGIGEVEDEK